MVLVLVGLTACNAGSDTTTTTAVSTTATSVLADSGSPDELEVPRGGEVRVTASSSVVCNGGGEVYVLADGADVAITGSCQEVEVRSRGALIEVETTIEVDVYGSDNEIEVVEARETDVYGDGNTLVFDSVREIDVYGNNNQITFSAGNPEVDDEGQGNTVTQG